MIICFVGPSASGKTQTLEALLKKYSDKIEKVITCTTRKKRKEEEDGISYLFYSLDEFNEKYNSGELIEKNEYPPDSNCFYGINKKVIDSITNKGKTPIVIVDINGYERLKNIYGEKKVVCIFFYRSTQNLSLSLKERGTDPTETQKRLEYITKEYQDITKADFVVEAASIEESITQTIGALSCMGIL